MILIVNFIFLFFFLVIIQILCIKPHFQELNRKTNDSDSDITKVLGKYIQKFNSRTLFAE